MYGLISHQLTNNNPTNSNFQLFILLFNLQQVMEVFKGYQLDPTPIITPIMFFRAVQGIIIVIVVVVLQRWICCLHHHFQVPWATIYRLLIIIIWIFYQPQIIQVVLAKIELYLAMALINIIMSKIQLIITTAHQTAPIKFVSFYVLIHTFLLISSHFTIFLLFSPFLLIWDKSISSLTTCKLLFFFFPFLQTSSSSVARAKRPVNSMSEPKKSNNPESKKSCSTSRSSCPPLKV